MNLVGYIRANSTKEAEEEKSILQDFASNMGWRLNEFFIDIGFSGLDFDRPELQNLLRESCFFYDKIDGVLILEEKSLSRDLNLLLSIKGKMKINNVSIICVK